MRVIPLFSTSSAIAVVGIDKPFVRAFHKELNPVVLDPRETKEPNRGVLNSQETVDLFHSVGLLPEAGRLRPEQVGNVQVFTRYHRALTGLLEKNGGVGGSAADGLSDEGLAKLVWKTSSKLLFFHERSNIPVTDQTFRMLLEIVALRSPVSKEVDNDVVPADDEQNGPVESESDELGSIKISDKARAKLRSMFRSSILTREALYQFRLGIAVLDQEFIRFGLKCIFDLVRIDPIGYDKDLIQLVDKAYKNNLFDEQALSRFEQIVDAVMVQVENPIRLLIVCFQLARIYLSLGEREGALRCQRFFKASLHGSDLAGVDKSDPISIQYCMALAVLSGNLGLMAEEQQQYDRLLSVEHSIFHSELRCNLADYYYLKGQYTIARSQYEKALQQDAHSVRAYNGLLVLALDNYDGVTAVQHLRKIIAIEPSNPSFRIQLAKLYRLVDGDGSKITSNVLSDEQKQLIEEQLQEVEKLDWDPGEDPTALLSLASLYWDLGDVDASNRYLNQFMENHLESASQNDRDMAMYLKRRNEQRLVLEDEGPRLVVDNSGNERAFESIAREVVLRLIRGKGKPSPSE